MYSYHIQRIPRLSHQPDRHLLASHLIAADQQPQSIVSFSAYHKRRESQYGLSSGGSNHVFENESDVRLISSGFSVNKSTSGSFILTSVTSSDIRRLEVDDVIAAIDGYVLSQKDTLDDVVYLLEEPIGTVARLTLVKGSGGVSGVMRKSVQFLRMYGLQRDEKFGHPFNYHDADDFTQSDELGQIDATQGIQKLKQNLPNSAHFYDADESCHSDYTDVSASVASRLSESEISLAYAGVGITLREDKTPNQTFYVVDNVLQQSPAYHCGKVDGMNAQHARF